MDSLYDVQQLLKEFGTFIYTGSRMGDLELMAMEIEELHKVKVISVNEYLQAKLLVKQAIKKLQ